MGGLGLVCFKALGDHEVIVYGDIGDALRTFIVQGHSLLTWLLVV